MQGALLHEGDSAINKDLLDGKSLLFMKANCDAFILVKVGC
jgi:hypothetical protein